MPRKTYQNPLSRFGATMAIAVFITDAFFLALDYFGVRLNPLIGIISYTLLPALLLLYLFLIPVGMYREWRRRRRHVGEEIPRYPRVDLNIKSHRTQFYVFLVGTCLVGLLILAVAYRAYEFTESAHFCSDVCHSVMRPESVTYKASPHARVECSHCHVGKGATWYAKSKLSGLYQIYATLFNKYPRPIETPVRALRPSLDTCEQCHWPSKFYGGRQVLRTHYQEDEKNTPRQFFMLLNVGGGIKPTGIHWHVGQDEVYYIARDKARQDIPWVKVKYKDGKEAVFVDKDNPPDAALMEKGELRRMDCIDCHNRPTHIFQSPRQAMDEALSDGRIDRTLPFIKKIGVEVLSREYPSTAEAKKGIRESVYAFYKEKYPALAEEKAGLVEKTIGEIQTLWTENNFPDMKSKWSIYPNNVGHLIWPGCFRCHDDNHKDDQGATIKKECNLCHLFLSEELSGTVTAETNLGRPFEHPADVGGAERTTNCTGCHANY